MMEFLNSYLSSLRSTFLSDEYLNEISKADSVSTIYEILKKTPYSEYMDYRDTIKITIEKALFKRFGNVVSKVRKYVNDEILIYMIAEYESKNLLIMLDEKYRNVENPKILSFLDNKEYLIKEYRRINNVIGFMKITTLGKFINIKEYKNFTNLSYSIDLFVIKSKLKLAEKCTNIRDIIKIELANKMYLVEKYVGERVLNYSPNLILPEVKNETNLFKAEQKLNEIIFEKYRAAYPRTWMSLDKVYIIFKLLDRERRFINKVINRENWGYRK